MSLGEMVPIRTGKCRQSAIWGGRRAHVAEAVLREVADLTAGWRRGRCAGRRRGGVGWEARSDGIQSEAAKLFAAESDSQLRAVAEGNAADVVERVVAMVGERSPRWMG